MTNDYQVYWVKLEVLFQDSSVNKRKEILKNIYKLKMDVKVFKVIIAKLKRRRLKSLRNNLWKYSIKNRSDRKILIKFKIKI